MHVHVAIDNTPALVLASVGMPNTDPPALTALTADQLAAALGVHVESVRRWSRDRRIPYFHVGGSEREYRRYDLVAVREALQKPVDEVPA